MASSVVSFSSSNPSIFGNVLRHQNENNILKLKLKKPKSWNWELSTSKSSAHIDFPRILLYDNNDKLLADIEEANLIINSKENVHNLSTENNDKHSIKKSNSFSILKSTPNSFKHSTLNGYDGLNQSIRSQTVLLHRLEKNQSKCCNDDKVIESTDIQNDVSTECIQLPEAPIYIYSAKGLVKRDFNAKEFDALRNRTNLQPMYLNKQTKHTNDQCTISEVAEENVPQHQLNTITNIHTVKNPLKKCQSMAEIHGNDLSMKKPKRKIRRSKSSVSAIWQLQNMAYNDSSTSSEENDSYRMKRTAYRIQKSAAGAIVVPIESISNERVRNRRRRNQSKSIEQIERINRNKQIKAESDRIPTLCKPIYRPDNSMPNLLQPDFISTTPEILPSSKNKTKRLNMQNGVISSTCSFNNINNSNDVKQKKASFNRKVSFVQHKCESNGDSCTENIRNDIINSPPNGAFNQCGKCIQPNSTKKKQFRKIKKSASVAGFYNDYTMSSSLLSVNDIDASDLYSKSTERHKKRRVSQRHKFNITSCNGKSVFFSP